MKRIAMMLCVFALLFGSMAACGPSGGKCDPACGAGEVCFAEDGKTYECKKSCTKDEDCTAPMVCHTDENPAHCGAKG